MNWSLQLTKPPEKDLKKFSREDQGRILEALLAMEHNPFSGDIKRLQPSDGWRRRVGNYRILYELAIEHHLIFVTAIARRTSTTY